MPVAKGQRGYLSRLSQPIPAGAAALKPLRPAVSHDWRELVLEVLDAARPQPSLPDDRTERKPAAQDAVREVSETVPAHTTSTPIRRAPVPRESAHLPIEACATDRGTAKTSVDPARAVSALQTGFINSGLPSAPPAQAETPSAGKDRRPIAAAARESAGTEAVLGQVRPRSSSTAFAPPRPDSSAPQDKRQSESHLEFEPRISPAMQTGSIRQEGAAQFSRISESRGQRHNSRGDHGEIAPLRSMANDKEAEPQKRQAARVHIGKLEVRLSAPPPSAVQPAQAPQRELNSAGRAATTAPQPLARDLAWTFGLVQG